MPDHPTPNNPSSQNPPPDPETPGGSRPFNLNAPRPTGRPIYESSLLPARKRRRLPPWLVIPGLLLILLAALYFLIFAPKPRRAVVTVGQVVYAAGAAATPNSHLWIASNDGSGARPLTSGAGADTSPVFTADGSQLAFLSNRAGGLNQIYVVDADGKNVTQVTRTAGAKSQPAFAPGSNTLLGFLSGGVLSYADSGKGDPTLLLPTRGQSSHPNDTTDPSQVQEASTTVVGYAWKPGGDGEEPGLAAVLESGGLQTLAILPSLSSAPRLTGNGQSDGPPLAAGDGVSPAWSPDGTRLAVAVLHVLSAPGQPKVSGLVTLDAQGNPVGRLFLTPPGSPSGPENPVFSPDGSQIAFELWNQPDLASRRRLGLGLVPSDGGSVRLLVRGDAGSAQFSRDSRQIFFLNRRADGGHDLCRINADGSGPARVSDGKADVTGFALSPQAARP